MGDQSDLSVGAPHGKRSVRPDPIGLKRLHCPPQQRAGFGVFQRESILRSPMHVVARPFQEFVGDKNPACTIKDKSWQANRRQHRAHSADALELEPRRHERCASQMGSKSIQVFDCRGFNRTARVLPLNAEKKLVTRGQLDRSRRAPA
jgi:hypothetical protein